MCACALVGAHAADLRRSFPPPPRAEWFQAPGRCRRAPAPPPSLPNRPGPTLPLAGAITSAQLSASVTIVDGGPPCCDDLTITLNQATVGGTVDLTLSSYGISFNPPSLTVGQGQTQSNTFTMSAEVGLATGAKTINVGLSSDDGATNIGSASLVIYDNAFYKLTVGAGAACTVPSIPSGVGAWQGANCLSGASNVGSGTTCVAVPTPGYHCTDPGLCTNGVFAAEGECSGAWAQSACPGCFPGSPRAHALPSRRDHRRARVAPVRLRAPARSFCVPWPTRACRRLL